MPQTAVVEEEPALAEEHAEQEQQHQEEDDDDEDFLLDGAPDEFICPISHKLMINPVIALDGRVSRHSWPARS